MLSPPLRPSLVDCNTHSPSLPLSPGTLELWSSFQPLAHRIPLPLTASDREAILSLRYHSHLVASCRLPLNPSSCKEPNVARGVPSSDLRGYDPSRDSRVSNAEPVLEWTASRLWEFCISVTPSPSKMSGPRDINGMLEAGRFSTSRPRSPNPYVSRAWLLSSLRRTQ